MDNDTGKIISLIVTDLDGTLLDSSSKITNENLLAISFLKEKNVPVIFCTGRPFSIVRKYIHSCDANSIVISCNGAVIIETESDKILYSKCITNIVVKKIIDFCLLQKLDCLVYTENADIFFSKNSVRVNVFTKYNSSIENTNEKRVALFELEKNLKDVCGLKICKILIHSDDEIELEKTRQYLEQFEQIYVVSSMKNVIDVMATGVSKGNAIEKISELLNIDLQNICAVGDNENDISMFEVVGFSACLANGSSKAKVKVDYVSKKDNNDSGFSEIIEYFFANV